MNIKYSKDALKFLAKLESGQIERIRAGIQGLTDVPPAGDIKTLKGEQAGRMRLRIGGFRIIFRYGKDGQNVTLYILDIGNRGDIYK